MDELDYALQAHARACWHHDNRGMRDSYERVRAASKWAAHRAIFATVLVYSLVLIAFYVFGG